MVKWQKVLIFILLAAPLAARAETNWCVTEPKFPRLVGLFAPGMRSEQVKLLQQMLVSDTTISPVVEVNGVYDDKTIRAVQNFQRDHGILDHGTPETNAYGWAGPQTRKTMNKVYGGKPTAEECATATPANIPEPAASSTPPTPPVPETIDVIPPAGGPPLASTTPPVLPSISQSLFGDWSVMGVIRGVASLLRP